MIMALPLRKTAFVIAGIALLAAALWWAFRPEAVPVDMETVARGPLEVTVSDDGRTRIIDVYTVSAPVAGTVQRAPGSVGDRVEAGRTAVARIRPAAPAFLDARTRREAQAALAAAEAAVRLAEAQAVEAQAELDLAMSEQRRVGELARRNVVSERIFDEANAGVRRAEARRGIAAATLEMRQREMESAQARLIGPEDGSAAPNGECCVVVTAPVDGEVLTIHHESEAVVAAGTPLVEIGDPARLEVVAELLSADAVRVSQGADARIEGWGGTPLQARVRRIEPSGFTKVSTLGIEEQRVRVILDLPGPAEERPGLGHGYRVNVAIVVERHDDVLMAPLGALFRQGTEWAVFTVGEDGRAALRRIRIGARDARHALVEDGLAEGERVILHPSDRVADGVAVAAR
jgi:HlyD family secretion protein